jgi:hypothetical protein
MRNFKRNTPGYISVINDSGETQESGIDYENTQELVVWRSVCLQFENRF